MIRSTFFFLAMNIACAAALGQTEYADTRPYEPFFELPGGSRLIYYWNKPPKDPAISMISYGGPPEWVVSQKHPRSHWHKIATLEEIELNTATITADEMKYIAGLRTVKSLVLSDSLFEGSALDPLENMTWLISVSIDCNSQLALLESREPGQTVYKYPRGDFFKCLTKLKELRAFTLYPECDAPTFGRLCGLSKLKTLSLGRIGKLSAEQGILIRNLRQLDSISFEAHQRDLSAILEGLRNHEQVKVFSLECTSLEPEDISRISSMGNLTRLYIHGKSTGSVSPLGNLKHLTHLHLKCKTISAPDGGRFLADLQALEDLVLSGSSDITIKHLSGLPKLTSLTIDQTLAEADIEIVKSIPGLRTLHVANSANSEWHASARRQLKGVLIKCAPN